MQIVWRLYVHNTSSWRSNRRHWFDGPLMISSVVSIFSLGLSGTPSAGIQYVPTCKQMSPPAKTKEIVEQRLTPQITPFRQRNPEVIMTSTKHVHEKGRNGCAILCIHPRDLHLMVKNRNSVLSIFFVRRFTVRPRLTLAISCLLSCDDRGRA